MVSIISKKNIKEVALDKLENLRVYKPEECAVFCKTRERFGGNSNMAAGFPLLINDIEIRTSEALYQACRFPSRIDVQKKIIAQRSPMSAKMVGKPYRRDFNRRDWNLVQVMIMRWCLRAKLLQNWNKFSRTLLETENLPIVELSTRSDDFWGAIVPVELERPRQGSRGKNVKYVVSENFPAGCLVGYNVMGRLIQELRENVKLGIDQLSADFTKLLPLPIENFLLYGELIEEIIRR